MPRLRERGTRVISDVNVDYFTPAEGTFYYRGMAPTEAGAIRERAQEMAGLSDLLIADSIHIEQVCAKHHPKVRWVPDNVELSLRAAIPALETGREAGSPLEWRSGEAFRIVEHRKCHCEKLAGKIRRSCS